MRQMLSSIQESPLIGMGVLVIFSALFGYIVFEAYRKKNKGQFDRAAHLPLMDEEQL